MKSLMAVWLEQAYLAGMGRMYCILYVFVMLIVLYVICILICPNQLLACPTV